MIHRDAALVAALAVRCDPDDPVAQTGLAWFAARRGEKAAALAAARRAVSCDEPPAAAWSALEALTEGRVDRMVLPAPGIARSAGPPDARLALVAGVEAHRHDALAVAELCYRAAAGDGRFREAALGNLMVLHEQRGETVEADALWAGLSDAASWRTLHNRATVLARRGEGRAARRLLADHHPVVASRAELLFLAGYLALIDGDAAAGRLALEAALARDPELARAHFAAGIAYDRLDRPGQAIAAIRRALVSSPWFAPEVWILSVPGRESGVEQAAGTAGPDSAEEPTDQILLALGRSLLFTGQHVEALAVFDQVLLRHPEHPAARFHRGAVLAKLRRYGEALADWRQVQATVPPGSELAVLAASHSRSAGRLAELFAGAAG